MAKKSQILETTLDHYPITPGLTAFTIFDKAVTSEFKDGPFTSKSVDIQLQDISRAYIRRNDLNLCYFVRHYYASTKSWMVRKTKNSPEGYIEHPIFPKLLLAIPIYESLKGLLHDLEFAKPKVIICHSKWALFLLLGLSDDKALNSELGLLLKWRSSHCTVHPAYGLTFKHILLPILPYNIFYLQPDKAYLKSYDLNRLSTIYAAAKSNNLDEYLPKPPEAFICLNISNDGRNNYEQLLEYFTRVYDVLNNAEAKVDITVDIETELGTISYIGFKVRGLPAISIPLMTNNCPSYWTEEQEVDIMMELYDIFTHKNTNIIGQNFTYDWQYFYRLYGWFLTIGDDTAVQSHSLVSTALKKLDVLAANHRKIHVYWKDDGKVKKNKRRDLEGPKVLPHDIQYAYYNAEDCYATEEVADAFRKEYEKLDAGRKAVYEFQMHEVLPATLKMMSRGFNIDLELREQYKQELINISKRIQEDFNYALQETINLQSPIQLNQFVYDLLGLPKQFNRETGKLTLDESAVTHLISETHLGKIFLERLLEYRKVNKLISNFLSAKLDPLTGKLYTQFSVTGTNTLRFASSKTALNDGANVQVIPEGGKLSSGVVMPNLRKLIIPSKGYVFFDFDLDSADLRIVIKETGAYKLQEILDDGRSVYVELMNKYYGRTDLTKKHAQYRTFKVICHGSNYDGKPKTLSIQTGLNELEVRKVQDWYFTENPEIPKYLENLRREVIQKKYIENIFGVRRYFLDTGIPNLLNEAAAFRPQSCVAHVIKKAQVNIENNLPETRLLGNQHDSLIGEVPKKNHLDHLAEVKKCCLVEIPYESPIVIPVGMYASEKSWGDCKNNPLNI